MDMIINLISRLPIPAWAIILFLAIVTYAGIIELTNAIYNYNYTYSYPQLIHGFVGFFVICIGCFASILFEFKYAFFANLTLITGVMLILTSAFELYSNMHADQPENMRPAGIRFATGVWMLAIYFPLNQMEVIGGFIWGTMAATLFVVFTAIFVAACIRLTISFHIADKQMHAEKLKEQAKEVV